MLLYHPLVSSSQTRVSHNFLLLRFIFAFIIEWDRGMGDRGEDMQQMTAGRIWTRAAAFRTVPIWYALYLMSHRGTPIHDFLSRISEPRLAVGRQYVCQTNAMTVLLVLPRVPNVMQLRLSLVSWFLFVWLSIWHPSKIPCLMKHCGEAASMHAKKHIFC